MALLLLVEQLLEALAEFVQVERLELRALLIGQLARQFRLGQPLQQLIADVEVVLDTHEERGEGAVVVVEVRLPLDHQATGQVVEDVQVRPAVADRQRPHQGKPLRDRHLQAVAPQVVEEVDEHYWGLRSVDAAAAMSGHDRFQVVLPLHQHPQEG